MYKAKAAELARVVSQKFDKELSAEGELPEGEPQVLAPDEEGDITIDTTALYNYLVDKFTPMVKRMLKPRAPKRRELGIPVKHNAYNLFIKERFDEQKQKGGESTRGSSAELKDMAEAWNNLSEKEKEDYKRRADEEYQKALKEWQDQHPDQSPEQVLAEARQRTKEDTKTADDTTTTTKTTNGGNKGKGKGKKTGYNLFQKDPDTVAKAKKMVEDGEYGKTNQATSKLWRDLSDEERQSWKDSAQKLNEQSSQEPE